MGFDGFASLCCVSDNEERFVDLAPIRDALGLELSDTSARFKGQVRLHRRLMRHRQHAGEGQENSPALDGTPA